MSTRGTEYTSARAAPFFDHGIFLLHLNRGKEEMRGAQYDGARREFEEAQRLRPHDPEVLSQLSFALFHLGHFEDAERITRDLLKTHGGSVPLLFNLGLILFKSGRIAEAVEPLEGVLALVPGHRKAHLTLGLVLQRVGKGEEAQRHFQMAGAELKAGAEGDDTVSRSAREAAAQETADGEAVPPAPVVKPETVQEADLKRPHESAAPKAATPAEERLLPPLSLAEHQRRLPQGAFILKSGGFVSADCKKGLYVRRGVLTGRSGAPALESDRRLGGPLANLLIRASGEGTLLLVDRGRRPFLKALADEFLSVEPGHLVAFEGSLTFREDPSFEFRRQIALPFVKLYGSGVVALSAVSEPARFAVEQGNPLAISAAAVLAYGGDVVPDLMEGTDPLAEYGAGPVLRFVGSGFVLADAS